MILKYIIYISFAYYYQVCYSEVYDNKINHQANTLKTQNVDIIPIFNGNSSNRARDSDRDRDYVVFGSNLIANTDGTANVNNRYRSSDIKSDRYQILKDYLKDFSVHNETDELSGIRDGSLPSDAILQYLNKARNLVTENIQKLYENLENKELYFSNDTFCEDSLNKTLCDSCDFSDFNANTSDYIFFLNNITKHNNTSLNDNRESMACINLLLSATRSVSDTSKLDRRRLFNEYHDSSQSVSLSVAQWVRVSAYVVIFVLGVVGNGLVVATLLYHRNMRTITNIFLLNLAVSDLLLGVFCMPFTLVGSLLRDFIFGGAMCKLIPYMQAVSISVSVWTLVAISLERYYAICKPLTSRQWQTMRHASQVVAVVWISSTILMLPIAVLSELVTFKDERGHIRHKCRENWPNKTSDRTFNILLSSFLLLVPLIIMGVAYMKVVRCLSKGISMEKRQVLAFPENAAKVVCSNGSDSSKLSVRFKKFPKSRIVCSEQENDIESSESSVSVREGIVKSKSGDLDSNEIVINDDDKVKYLAEILSTVKEDQTKEEDSKVPSRYVSSLKVLKNSFKRKKHKREGSEVSFVEKNSGTSDDRSQETDERAETPSESRFKCSWRRKMNSSESSHLPLRPIRSTHLRQSLVAKQRVIRMLFVLVAEFFICWTPLFLVNSLYLWIPSQIYGRLGNVGISLIQLLAYASSCCNPITYCFMNATFFQSFKQAFSFKERRASRLQRSFMDRGAFQSSLRETPNFEISVVPSNKNCHNVSRKNAINTQR